MRDAAVRRGDRRWGYADVEDPSVFVAFTIVESPHPELVGAHLLGWTTTPWTLISNCGVAVAPEAMYVTVEHAGSASVARGGTTQDVVPRMLGRVGRPFDGATLVGTRYEPLCPNVEGAHRVVAADFVSLEDGTGVVHLAPAFGPEDLEIGRREGVGDVQAARRRGPVHRRAPAFVRGEFFKDADEAIIAPTCARAGCCCGPERSSRYPCAGGATRR